MFFGEELTWNLRDRHFLACVEMTREHLATRVGPAPKLVRLLLQAASLHSAHSTQHAASRGRDRRGSASGPPTCEWTS